MPNTTFIYALIDPRDNCVRYIGKSNGPYRRVSGHLKPYTQATSAKHKWIAELTRTHLRPHVLILDESPDEEWEAYERAWIEFYGKTLTNGTSGGKGAWKRSAAAHIPLTHRVVKLPPEEIEELRGAGKELIMEVMRCGLQHLRLERALTYPDQPEMDLEEMVRNRAQRAAEDTTQLKNLLSELAVDEGT